MVKFRFCLCVLVFISIQCSFRGNEKREISPIDYSSIFRGVRLSGGWSQDTASFGDSVLLYLLYTNESDSCVNISLDAPVFLFSYVLRPDGFREHSLEKESLMVFSVNKSKSKIRIPPLGQYRVKYKIGVTSNNFRKGLNTIKVDYIQIGKTSKGKTIRERSLWTFIDLYVKE